jgi:hypothetical protein
MCVRTDTACLTIGHMVRRKEAGRRAAQKYAELKGLWLRRTRAFWLKAGLVVLALAAATNLSLLWLSSYWNWLAGAVTGALIAMFIIAREEPPAYIENWQLGRWGEERTEKVLRPLEREGWRVHHDLPSAYGKGNLDHVVIGPGGVFLLDSKRWAGEVTVEGDVATVRRLEDPSLSYRYDASRGVVPLAMQVRDRLKAATRATQYVQAVVVVWGEFPEHVSDSRCSYVHGEHLVTWLQQQPLRVSPQRVEQFSAAIRDDRP